MNTSRVLLRMRDISSSTAASRRRQLKALLEPVRLTVILLSLAATLPCIAGARTFDLMEIAHIESKGRVQDQQNLSENSQMSAILAMGKDAIPILIGMLESDRPYGTPPLDFWPTMVEGDLALVLLTDLFLDPTWRQSTLPELCWDNLLERSSEDLTAHELLDRFVKTHGRRALVQRWQEAWSKYGSMIRWDSAGKYFKVEGQELRACVPGT